jgi:hypothetical protein
MMATIMQMGYKLAPQILGMVLGGGGGGGGGGGLADLAAAFLGGGGGAAKPAAVNTKVSTTTADKTDKIGAASVSSFSLSFSKIYNSGNPVLTYQC